MMRSVTRWFWICGVLAAVTSAEASAQTIGTFRWQFAPYCNVVTLLVEQKGSVFALTGTDDGCDGAAPAATVNGVAHVNAGGTVSMSLTIVRPDAFVVNAAIQLTPATLSGTWRDDWANSGTFTFNPLLPIGAPPRRLTMRGDWSVAFLGSTNPSQSRTSISFPHPLPFAPGAASGNIVPVGGVPTANCPGTIADPQAAPGQLCVYEQLQSNSVGNVVLFSGGSPLNEVANPNGFGILVNAAENVGYVLAYGRWAVTVP